MVLDGSPILFCLSVCPVLFVCDFGVLWPNSWMDQDETYHRGRPRVRPHCVRWGPSSPSYFSAHVCRGQMAGCTKMPLGMEVDNFVLDRDPAPPQKRDIASQIFGSCLLWPNGSVDQDATWYGSRTRPRWHCVRWGQAPKQNKGAQPNKGTQPPIYSPCLLWPNSWMHQDTTWYGGRPRPGRLCDFAAPSRKGARPP